MSNQLIMPLYKEIFGVEFQNAMDCRIALQKVVYLLEELGIVMGDYSFSWYKYGPYSPELQEEIRCPGKSESNSGKLPWNFCKEVRDAVNEIKTIVDSEQRGRYSIRYWLEAVASLLYLKRYMYRSYSDDELLQELHNRKDYLGHADINQNALKLVKDKFLVAY